MSMDFHDIFIVGPIKCADSCALSPILCYWTVKKIKITIVPIFKYLVSIFFYLFNCSITEDRSKRTRISTFNRSYDKNVIKIHWHVFWDSILRFFWNVTKRWTSKSTPFAIQAWDFFSGGFTSLERRYFYLVKIKNCVSNNLPLGKRMYHILRGQPVELLSERFLVRTPRRVVRQLISHRWTGQL